MITKAEVIKKISHTLDVGTILVRKGNYMVKEGEEKQDKKVKVYYPAPLDKKPDVFPKQPNYVTIDQVKYQKEWFKILKK